MKVLNRDSDESSAAYHAMLKTLSTEGWSDHYIKLRAEQLWAVRAAIRREASAAIASCSEIPPMTARDLETRVRQLKTTIEARQAELASLENQHLALKDQLAEAKLPKKMAQ